MRLAFRRSALFAAVSLIAVGAATTALAQPVADTPSQDEQAQPDAEPATLSQTMPSPSGQQSEPQPPAPLIDKMQSPEPEDKGDQDPFIEVLPSDLDAPAPDETEGETEGEVDAADEAEAIIPIPAEWAPVPSDALGRTAFGQYLAGRYAMRQGHSVEAAGYLARAKALTPEQPRLQDQLFSAALLAGRIDLASGSIPNEDDVSPFLSQAARLVSPVQALSEGNARLANQLLKDKPAWAPHRQAGVYFQVWVAAMAGDWDRALAAPPTDLDPLSALLARGNRAALLEHRRLYDEAEAEWQDLVSHAVASRLFRLPYGQFLERRGRRDEALVQYQAAVTAGAADRRTYQAMARVEAKGRAPTLTHLKTGAVQALVTASDQVSAQEGYQVGLIYLRLAQAIQPSGELSLQIAQTMRKAGLEPQARAELETINPSDEVMYGVARYQMAMSYQEGQQLEEALAELLKAEAVAADDRGLIYNKAAILLQLKRYEEALELLNGPVLNTEDQGFEIYFLRGAAYSWLNQIEPAEANLWQALQMQPNNAMVLNHLGYQWVDQGSRVAEGAALIAKAFAAEPNDGNIQDSLGWAQYRQGLYDEAVVNLEGAVDKEPANPEINDHLGDAYWMIGRHREASFQWQRVLSLDAEPERRTAVEAKLAVHRPS
jgi:tetratricopeptide (TPR) repeat protein